MNSDERIIEILSDMLDEQRGMRKDINEMKNDINVMKLDIAQLKEHQAKTNLAIGELRLSVMKLADRLEIIAEHEKRIDRLEQAVFHSS
ncbi:MAG: hypothetical protein N2319_02300 [Candidatus Kapabacteria bacterium]|nr:hypothetical protein [Candidatus Kapabacteria bacterium]